jgi:hypothetical protein
MPKSSLFVGMAAIFLSSSCATLFTSNDVTVQMNSDPPGAKYDVGPFSGKTPDSIAIPKKSIPDFATFELPGYEKRTVPVESGIAGVFWINVLFWPGMIVDIVTGDYKTLSVAEISATLTPLAGEAAAGASPPAVPPKISPAAAIASDQPKIDSSRAAAPTAAPPPQIGDQWKSSDNPH